MNAFVDPATGVAPRNSAANFRRFPGRRSADPALAGTAADSPELPFRIPLFPTFREINPSRIHAHLSALFESR